MGGREVPCAIAPARLALVVPERPLGKDPHRRVHQEFCDANAASEEDAMKSWGVLPSDNTVWWVILWIVMIAFFAGGGMVHNGGG